MHTLAKPVWKKVPIAPEHEAELRLFEENIRRLEAGELDSDDFKKFRLENGVYGIRHTTDEHMIRIKVRFGNITPDQLEAVAEAVEQFATPKVGHITTRQAIQMHHVKRRDLPAVLRIIAESGLTTREACGNTVRNVSCCQFAGISPTEVFDCTPYADLVSRHFLRNLINQNLPRKFKIAFEGCPIDHARVPIHDLGFVAKVRNEGGKRVRGFSVYVGGGLGATPHSAQLLEEFMPEELILPTGEAVLRIFDRHGNRKDKTKARIKFVVKAWGIEKFREMFLQERKIALLTRSGKTDFSLPPLREEAPPEVSPSTSSTLPLSSDSAQDEPAYQRWKQTNVLNQKQSGYSAVTIRCLYGDITVEQMRALAQIARAYGGGRLRTIITQNLLLRWVPDRALPSLYQELRAAGLAEHSADRVADITRCPGADTCQIAITHSRGLAMALTPLFSNGLGSAEELQDIKIKISGCFNSCGQHHIADLGFYGASKVVNGREVPHYVLLLGGYTQEGLAKFGRPTLQIPAKRVPEAIKKLFEFFRTRRQKDEPFRAFLDRQGPQAIKDLLQEYIQIPSYEEAPQLYEDLGDEGRAFKVELGKGECAA